MADNRKKPDKKEFKFSFNISWIYFLLLIGIGWMFFNQGGANPQKEEWADVQKQWLAGDIKEVVFIRNEYEGRVTIKPDALAKYRTSPLTSSSLFPAASMPRKCSENLMQSFRKMRG